MWQTELVHLLGGPSGGGKTRWLIPMLHNQWSKGQKVMGHKVYPCEWAYVPLDRMMASVEQSFETMGIKPYQVNIIPALDAGMTRIGQILDAAEYYQAKLIVIEMFSYLLEGPHTPEAIRDWMGAVGRMLHGTGMTIIGTMEAPKMKPKDFYKNPRQRISGHARWGHMAETVMLAEPNFKDESKRIIGIYTRNDIAEEFDAKFDGGRLVITRKRSRKSIVSDDEIK